MIKFILNLERTNMNKTLITIATLLCIANLGCSKQDNYKDKYDKLQKSYNSLLLSNALPDKYLAKPEQLDWHTNGVFILRNYEVGEIEFHQFKLDNEWFPASKSAIVNINDGNGIYLPNVDNIIYDAEYVEFIYKGLKYFICLTKNNCKVYNAQVFGKQFGISVKRDEYFDGMRFSDSTRFWFSNYEVHKTFVKKWFIDDNEYMTISKTDFGRLAIEFHVVKKEKYH